MPQVRSRTNGLIINIPADAAGVVSRFATQGGNDLIFEKNSLGMNGKRPAPEKALTVRSLAPDPGSPDAREQAAIDAAADNLT